MLSMYEDVVKFHQEILGIPPKDKPTFEGTITTHDRQWCTERADFIFEELQEFHEACYKSDMVGAVDGLLDIIYVALGTLYMMGIPVEQCWAAVQKANMAKVRGMTKRGNLFDATKPEGWVGPEEEIKNALQTIDR